MNIISHDKAYALYPQSTFITNRALIIETAGAGQEAGRQKYMDRGWTMIKRPNAGDDEFDDIVRWVGDRFTWTISLPPLLVAVPDLCIINSWELWVTPSSVTMQWHVLEQPTLLKHKYIVAPHEGVFGTLDKLWEYK